MKVIVEKQRTLKNQARVLIQIGDYTAAITSQEELFELKSRHINIPPLFLSTDIASIYDQLGTFISS
jgi:hypothetical protein